MVTVVNTLSTVFGTAETIEEVMNLSNSRSFDELREDRY